MKAQLRIKNPSDYSRDGNASIPWEDLVEKYPELKADNLVVRDETGVRLRFQLDPIDSPCPMKPRLHFTLDRELEEKKEIIISIENTSIPEKPMLGKREIILTKEIMWGYEGHELGVRLVNNRLILWLNFIPAPNETDKDWYSGAFTSVQLDHKELLDPFTVEFSGHGQSGHGHHIEKRCSQINFIKVGETRIDLFNQPYDLILHSIGLVRASVTLASASFEIGDSTYRLYREINLYPELTHVLEHLMVCEVGKKQGIEFSAGYFSFINLGHNPQFQAGTSDNYFVVGTPFQANFVPFPSYGFAANTKVTVLNDITNLHKGDIGWEIAPTNKARCFHSFMRDKAEQTFNDRMWHRWNEFLANPLQVSVV
jgi:hypothetical protein